MSVQIITSRHTVNRLSDFQVDMVLEKDGVLYMPASFVMAFYVGEWSCEDAYVASRLDGQTTNCEISGSVISVYFNSPGFPLGQLKCRVFDSVDNAAFTDGTLDTCTPLTLPIEIVATAGDSEVISLYTDGYQPPATGIPKGDLEQSVQDTLDSVANKVDKEQGKGLSTEDFTAALKAKLEALDPYTKAEVDDKVANAGKVKSVSINGQTKTPDSQGNVDLGTVVGQQGPQGNVAITDASEIVTIIENNLDSSDGNAILSARQGKILKQAISTVQANLQAVVDALANMAFTSAKPTLSQIDWTGGTFYATINKTLNGCTTQNMNTEQVAEGQQFSMVLFALTGYTLTGAVISVTNSKGQSVAYTFDNNTLTIAAANVEGTINISVSAKTIYQISLGSGSRNVAFASGTSTEATSGSSWTGTIEVTASGHKLPASIDVTMGGNPVTPAYDPTSGEITIANVTGNIVITAVAEEVGMINIQYNTDKWRNEPSITKVSMGSPTQVVITPKEGCALTEVKYTVDGGSEQTGTIVDNSCTLTITANTSVVINTKSVIKVYLAQYIDTTAGGNTVEESRMHANNVGLGSLLTDYIPVDFGNGTHILYMTYLNSPDPGYAACCWFYNGNKNAIDYYGVRRDNQPNGRDFTWNEGNGVKYIRATFRYTDAVYNESEDKWYNPDNSVNDKERAFGDRYFTANDETIITEQDIKDACAYAEQQNNG